MKKDYELTYHQVEKDHFWFKGRRKYITEYLKDFPKDATVLDIGSSSGLLLNELADLGFDRSKLYGIDISETAIANCKENGIENAFVMDAQQVSFGLQFDIVIASDCLEHLKDEQAALQSWARVLKDTGTMMVFVPAFMSLWSDHDVANMHYRRYTLPQLEAALNENGLVPTKSSYWNFSLFTPVYLLRALSRLKPKKGKADSDLNEPSALNGLIYGIINTENKLLRRVNFPFGISAFCIVRKG